MAKPTLKPGVYETEKGKLFAYQGNESNEKIGLHPIYNVHVYFPNGKEDWVSENESFITQSRRLPSKEVEEHIERLSQGRQTTKNSQLLEFLKENRVSSDFE